MVHLPIFRILGWLIPAAWLFHVADIARGIPTLANLNLPAHDLTPAGNPSLTVIVPARNEASNVAACLHSLLAQDYPNLRIIAVDDRSTDETGAIMDSLAGPTLSVLHIAELPSGWLGKTHAMAQAAHQAASDFFLFTDADIVFRPDALRRALAQTQSTQADHFVLAPTTLIRRWDEGAIISFFQVISLWAVRPWKVADPRARDAIGIGAFNLLRREAYEKIGGFEALRMQVVEDLALARRVKTLGLRQRFAYGQGMASVHWAAGTRGLVSVMTKNTFAAINYHIPLVLVSCVWLWFFFAGPFVAFVRHPTDIANDLTLTLMAASYIFFSRLSGRSPWNFLLAPFAACVFLFIMFRSMLITLAHGGVEWRGTFYPLAELRKDAAPLNERRRQP